MFQMKWETPPPRRATPAGVMAETLEQLKAHPGRWALVAESKANGGQATWWKKHGCEATTRRDREAGLTRTYARWPAAASEPTEEAPAPEPAPTPAPAPSAPEPAPDAKPARRSGRPPAFTPEQEDQLLAARLEGATHAELLERFGTTRTTIVRALARAENRYHAAAREAERQAAQVVPITQGTCTRCKGRRRALTDGVCRLCHTRALETAALKGTA